MTDIIPIGHHSIGQDTVSTVDARLLHEFLQVKARFNDWISRRIEAYGFLQDIDFILSTSGEGYCAAKHYFLSEASANAIMVGERKKDIPNTHPKQYVYAARHGETQYIKIGRARNYRSRLTSLQVGNPIQVSFVAAWEVTDGILVEEKLHKQFFSYAHQGDWFALTEKALSQLYASMEKHVRVL